MTFAVLSCRLALMCSSSHKPGCMAAMPASQSCRVRRVLCMAAAHSSCVQPVDFRRACRASGEKAPRGLLRFGWLAIGLLFAIWYCVGDEPNAAGNAAVAMAATLEKQAVRNGFDYRVKNLASADICSAFNSFGGVCHFVSLAPESRGAVVSDFAAHDCIISTDSVPSTTVRREVLAAAG